MDNVYDTPQHRCDSTRCSRSNLSIDNPTILRKSTRTSVMMKIALLIYAIAITIVAIVLLTISQSNNERNHYDHFYDDRKVMVKSSQAVARATNYLLSHQSPSGDWGSVVLNAQVIVSLRLASGINMARINSSSISSLWIDEYFTWIKNNAFQANSTIAVGQLAYVVMALKATCKKTNQFMGINLDQKLIENLESYPRPGFHHPYSYSLTLLSLCLTNAAYKVGLVTKLQDMQSADGIWNDLDTTAMAILALNCADGSSQAVIEKGVQALLSKQSKTTFQFGNEYTTAHVIQALLSQRVPISKWDYIKVLQGLLKFETMEHSFGRIDNTAAVLPSLAGAIYLDLKSIPCNQQDDTADTSISTIRYTVRYQCSPYINKTDENSVIVASKAGSSMLTFMRAAEKQNSAYQFSVKYHPSFNAYTVEKINNISSLASNHTCYWLLQNDVTNREIPLGISHYKPNNNAKVAFIYRRP